MTNFATENYIDTTLTKLRSLDLAIQRRLIEHYSSSPAAVDSEFFGVIVRESEDPICKWYAIRALGDLAAKEQLGTLIPVLEVADRPVGSSSLHLIAARSIGKIGIAAIEMLLPLLKSAKGDTLVAIVDALGEIGSAAAIPELARIVKSRDQNAALWAALSLAKIGHPSVAALHSLCKNADEERTYLIVDALARINHPSILATIEIAYKRFPRSMVNYLYQGPQPRVKKLLALIVGESKKVGQTAVTARRLTAAIGH